MARYPVVLFDIGETLVGPRESYGAVYHRVLAQLGVVLDQDLLERSIRDTSAAIAQRIPPGRDRFGTFAGGESEYWRRFVGEVLRRANGHEAAPRFVRQALERLWDAFGRTDAWCVYDDVVPALDCLQRDGTRLAVVSNWDSRLPRLLELLELADYFETVGVSHLEGVEKPDPTLFRRVLARLDAEPDEALHVGNVAELDLAGARGAGVDGVLIDRDGTTGNVAAIRDLRELPRIVDDGLDGGVSSGCRR